MIVVCKKYRCLEQTKGEFKKTEHMKLVRENLKLEKSYIDEQNKTMKTSGIYFEVDKEVTEKRNKPEGNEPTEKELLLAEAKELGLDVDGRTGIDKLKELIAGVEK